MPAPIHAIVPTSLLALLTAACSSTGTYVPPADDAPAATLIGEAPSFGASLDPLAANAKTWFVRVDDDTLTRSAWDGYAEQVRVTPGPHEVEVGGSIRQRGQSVASGSAVFRLVFEAGRTYQAHTALVGAGQVEISLETADTASGDGE
ncbi:MAG: hypothetical protein KAI24_07270 [Planctomycetes bacterium]|nr:hypothetical protein [Planctomycetota bacterium]